MVIVPRRNSFSCVLYHFLLDFKMLLTVMSLIEELLHDEDDTADQKIVKSKYSEAVVDFLIVLIERFVHAQVCISPFLFRWLFIIHNLTIFDDDSLGDNTKRI